MKLFAGILIAVSMFFASQNPAYAEQLTYTFAGDLQRTTGLDYYDLDGATFTQTRSKAGQSI